MLGLSFLMWHAWMLLRGLLVRDLLQRIKKGFLDTPNIPAALLLTLAGTIVVRFARDSASDMVNADQALAPLLISVGMVGTCFASVVERSLSPAYFVFGCSAAAGMACGVLHLIGLDVYVARSSVSAHSLLLTVPCCPAPQVGLSQRVQLAQFDSAERPSVWWHERRCCAWRDCGHWHDASWPASTH